MTRERLKALLKEYGSVAIWTYFAIFALVLIGSAVALAAGFQVEGAASSGGVLLAAYLTTKATQPLRILGTLALTPVVARVVRRFRPTHDKETSEPVTPVKSSEPLA